MGAADSLFSLTPYPGLRPFRSDEADIFFGREQQIDRLLEKLQRNHFVGVVGASGCGKSSLVKAGLIAGLESGFMGDAGHQWRIADMRPGNMPMVRLAESLLSPGALGPEFRALEVARPILAAQLRRGPLGLVEVFLECRLQQGTNLLLLVDQFEEIFRFRRLGDPNVADAFVALLLASSRQRQVPIYVIITMRSDFLGDCALFPGLPEAINESQYLTPRLTREQIRAAIAGPARVCGGSVDADLVNRLVNDVGPDPDQLPVLQHALMRMWAFAGTGREAANRATDSSDKSAEQARTVTLADYDKIGGLSKALSRHADEIFAGLQPPDQHIAEVMFRCLTDRGDAGRDTRRPATIQEIGDVAGVTFEDVARVAEVFRAPFVSFITPAAGQALTPETALDISHESLIHLWERLGRWVEDEARRGAMYQQLKQTALAWKDGSAELWIGRGLVRIIEWQAEVRPNAAWAQRYGSATDFSTALEFIQASKWQDRAQKLRRWGGRAAVVALVIVGASVWIRGQFQKARENASRELALASQDMLGFDNNKALLTAREAACLQNSDITKASVLRVLAYRRESNDFRLPADHRILAATYLGEKPIVLTEDAERRLRIFDFESGKLLSGTELGQPEEVANVALGFSVGGAFFFTVSEEATKRHVLRLWDTRTGRLISRLNPDHRIRSASLDFSGSRLAVVAENGAVQIWDARTGNVMQRMLTSSARLTTPQSVAFGPDGRRVLLTAEKKAAGKTEDLAIVLSAVTGQVEAEFSSTRGGGSWSAFFAVISPDGNAVATLSGDGVIRIWDIRTSRLTDQMQSQIKSPNSLAFGSDRGQLASVGLDGQIRLVDLRSRSESRINDAVRSAWSAEFAPGGREIIAIAGDFSTVRTWTADAATALLRLGSDKIQSAGFGAKGDLIATGNMLGSVDLWDAKEGLRTQRFESSDIPSYVLPGNLQTPNMVHAVSFSADDRSIVAAYADGFARVWDVNSGRLVAPTSTAHGSHVRCAAFSADQKFVVTASEDGKAGVWSASDGKLLRFLVHAAPDFPVCAAFSLDGQAIYTVSSHGEIWSWEWKGKAKPTLLRDLGKTLVAARIASGGDKLAAVLSGAPSTTWIVETRSQRLPLELLGQRWLSPFSARGSRFATIDDSGQVTVWDMGSGRAIWIPNRTIGSPTVVAASPEGDKILVGEENTARVYLCKACRPLDQQQPQVDEEVRTALRDLQGRGEQFYRQRFQCLSGQFHMD